MSLFSFLILNGLVKLRFNSVYFLLVTVLSHHIQYNEYSTWKLDPKGSIVGKERIHREDGVIRSVMKTPIGYAVALQHRQRRPINIIRVFKPGSMGIRGTHRQENQS